MEKGRQAEKGIPLREGLKIRHYIMNLIYRHPDETVMIPSSKEFAAMFGVARSTVTLVLKDLCDEGYLEGRRGIGTFTRHVNFIPERGRMTPLIGLLAGDGKYFYYPHQVWSVMAACGTELTGNGLNVRPITLGGSDDDEISNELLHQYLDGLIWLDSSPRRLPLIRELKSSGLKVIIQLGSNMDDNYADIDNFAYDLHTAGRETGRILLAEKRSRLVFVFENPLTASLLSGIREAYDAAGVPLEVSTFDWSQPEVFKEIGERLPELNPDAIYIHGKHYASMAEIISQQNIDTGKSCRLIAESHAVDASFSGITLQFPFEQAGQAMGARMRELLNHSDARPRQVRLPVTVKLI